MQAIIPTKEFKNSNKPNLITVNNVLLFDKNNTYQPSKDYRSYNDNRKALKSNAKCSARKIADIRTQRTL